MIVSLLSQKITILFIKKGYILEKEKDIYQYGFEILISSCVGISIILFLGLLFSTGIESILFLFCLISLRQYTGGYHAKSYLNCNLTLLGTYMICIFVNKILMCNTSIFPFFILILFLPFLFVIIRYAPIENINKSINKENKALYKIRSVIIFLSYYIFLIFLTRFNVSLGIFIFVVISLVIVTMVVEIIKQRLENYEKKCFQSNDQNNKFGL